MSLKSARGYYILALIILLACLNILPPFSGNQDIKINVFKTPNLYNPDSDQAVMALDNKFNRNWVVRYDGVSHFLNGDILSVSDSYNTCLIGLNTVGQDVGCHFDEQVLAISVKTEKGQLVSGFSVSIISPSSSIISHVSDDMPLYIAL